MCCKKCGNKVKPDATFCTRCGNKIELGEQNKMLVFSKYKKQIVIAIIALCFVGYFFGFRCKAGLCLLPSGLKGEYCIVHTCKRGDCTNKRAENKDYCYTHSPTASSGISYTPEVAENVLEFSDIRITHNSSFTVCTGTITNNGRKTYTFVEVKGKFKNSSGTVLDTDWTYAVGSEGLAPGESTSFRLSVDKNTNIKNCTMEILDYDKE